MASPFLLSTWSFSEPILESEYPNLSAGCSALDAVEACVRNAEQDKSIDSVGFGGLPDRNGNCTFDAMVMTSPSSSGAVCGIERHLHPVSIARLVMEKTNHTLLAGTLADDFADSHGMESANILADTSEQKWERVEFTNINGGYGVFLGLFGAIGGGFLADYFGAKRIATIGCIFLAMSYATFGLSSPETGIIPWFDWNTKTAMITYILFDTFVSSLISASLFAMYMTVSWPRVAATQFTAYMAILNLSTVIGLKSSGVISESFSLPAIFIAAAVLQLSVISFFPFIDVHQARSAPPANFPSGVVAINATWYSFLISQHETILSRVS